MRTWIWISLLSLFGLGATTALLAGPLALRLARSQAADRGLRLEVEDVTLRWMSAELRDVRVSLEGVTGVQGYVESVTVDFGWGSPRWRRLRARSGRVELDGSPADLKDRLLAWKKRNARPSSGAAPSGLIREDFVSDIEVVWKHIDKEETAFFCRGLKLEQSARGRRVGADLIELSRGKVSAKIAGGILALPAGPFDLARATAFGAAEVRLHYEAEAPPTAPSAPPAAASAGAPGPNVEAPAGSPESPTLDQRLTRSPERVLRLLAGLKLVQGEVFPRLPAKLDIERLWLMYARADQKLEIGPNQLTLTTSKGTSRVHIAPEATATGTPLTLSLVLFPPAEPRAASLELEGGPVSLRALGVENETFGLSGVQHTTVSGNVQLELSRDATEVRGGGKLMVEGLALDHPKLAQHLVVFPRVTLAGQGALKIDGSRYELKKGELTVGGTRLLGEVAMERGGDFVTLELNATAPLVSCQTLLDAAPRGLLGSVEKMRFSGTFSLELGVTADSRKLDAMDVRWNFNNGCRATAVPADLDPTRFLGSFEREVMGAGNLPAPMEFGTQTGNWVPRSELSPFVEKALLVTEDGRFFRHNGFDDRAIESAIRANTRAGTFVRGASTITMQLAKNLYLAREKTLARKLQEAALTSLLEQSFKKEELLELYVNVIEFGPGIYGIGPAAQYYFKKSARDLSASQAFFLASLLPAPTREYFNPDGTLSAGRVAYVHRLLGISAQRGALTQAELDLALDEVLMFGVPAPGTRALQSPPQAGADPAGPPVAGLPERPGDAPIFPHQATPHSPPPADNPTP